MNDFKIVITFLYPLRKFIMIDNSSILKIYM